MNLLNSFLHINLTRGAVRHNPLVVHPPFGDCPMLIIIKDKKKRIEFSEEVEKFLNRHGHEIVKLKSVDKRVDVDFKLKEPITDTNEYEKILIKVIKMAYKKGYEIE